MLSRAEEGCSGSTGLTQEIDIMDIGSSTPKRKKSKSPLKGVLKIRCVLCHLIPLFVDNISLYIPLCRIFQISIR